MSLILAVALALSSGAGDGCLVVHLEHDRHGPQVVETEGWPETSFPGRLGDHIWFQWGNGEPISVDVSDPTIDRVVGCPDGTVTIQRDAPVLDRLAETLRALIPLLFRPW